MLPLSPDTSPDAQCVLIRLLRDAPPWRKLEMVAQLNTSRRSLPNNALSPPVQHF